MRLRQLLPFLLPVVTFLGAATLGSLGLYLDSRVHGTNLAYVDAFFLATSAVCVTGLATVDPFSMLSRAGEVIMLVLIQLGGLGIMTYSALILHIFSQKISLGERIALGQSLFHSPAFHLGKFLSKVGLTVLLLEILGAVLIHFLPSRDIGLFNSIFMAVSSFCNAGFAPWPDNLISWRGDFGLNLTVCLLIILGGLGFFVLTELFDWLRVKLNPRPIQPGLKPRKLSFYSKVVLKTSAILIAGGMALILADLAFNPAQAYLPWTEKLLAAFFQSVTCRTAGFNTINLTSLSGLAVLAMIILMFIGGSPGSCAGGVKTTTLRVFAGYLQSRIFGRKQVVVNNRAIAPEDLNKALILIYVSILVIGLGMILLTLFENGFQPLDSRQPGLTRLFFEVVSAFGTVGLSLDTTPLLSAPSKILLCLIMFIGRLGPVWLLTIMQHAQKDKAYGYPYGNLPIG